MFATSKSSILRLFTATDGSTADRYPRKPLDQRKQTVVFSVTSSIVMLRPRKNGTAALGNHYFTAETFLVWTK
ncbi:hypothetical protein TNCV_3428381 [Trichonephila clavipes]|nr:hypothetical protein TNCV_3428381 [Trichonephila clavipes]